MERKKRKLSSTLDDDNKSIEETVQKNAKSAKTSNDNESQPKIFSKSAYFLYSTCDVKDTFSALEYLLDQFPSDIFPELPKQVFVHQIYSLIQNKTKVDREIESLRKENKIVMFKCDSKSFDDNDIVVCLYESFKDYVEKLFKASKSPLPTHKLLISTFTDKILIEQNTLSLQKTLLTSQYFLSDRDFTYLIQFGLFNIRDASAFWLAIPNFGAFRKMILETRKLVMDCIRKKKYKEMEFDELDKRHGRGKVSKLGLIYILHDLIGNDLISLMDVPNKSVFFKIKN